MQRHFIQQPTIRAQASAKVESKPDQVRIEIGVVTQASTAQVAGADNAKQFSLVAAELKKAAGDGAEIRTISYGISPNYKYSKDGGTPTIVSYTATNVVEVVSNDVAGAGKLIDAGTRTGANTVRGIEFRVKDEQALRAKALAEAARRARANVDAMASGLGLRISRVLQVDDISVSEPRPVRPLMAMRMNADMAASAPTPVESGMITIEATAVVTVEIAR